MSDTIKVWSWAHAIQLSKLSSNTKLVLFNLSNYMNAHGEGCFPSVSRQAIDCSISERAVYTALKMAEAAGFLIKEKRYYKGKLHNEYKAIYPDVDYLHYGFIEPTKPATEDQKHRARRRTSNRLAAGTISRQPCEVCGEAESFLHHTDYDDDALSHWLCQEHHDLLHRMEKRGLVCSKISSTPEYGSGVNDATVGVDSEPQVNEVQGCLASTPEYGSGVKSSTPERGSGVPLNEVHPNSPIELSNNKKNNNKKKLDENENDDCGIVAITPAQKIAAGFYRIRKEVFGDAPPESFVGKDVAEAQEWLLHPSATDQRIESILRMRMQQMRAKGDHAPPCVKWLGKTVRDELAKLPAAGKAAAPRPQRAMPICYSETMLPKLDNLREFFENMLPSGDAIWRAWIAPCSFRESLSRIEMACPSQFHLQHIQTHHLDRITRQLGREVCLCVDAKLKEAD